MEPKKRNISSSQVGYLRTHGIVLPEGIDPEAASGDIGRIVGYLRYGLGKFDRRTSSERAREFKAVQQEIKNRVVASATCTTYYFYVPFTNSPVGDSYRSVAKSGCLFRENWERMNLIRTERSLDLYESKDLYVLKAFQVKKKVLQVEYPDYMSEARNSKVAQ